MWSEPIYIRGQLFYDYIDISSSRKLAYNSYVKYTSYILMENEGKLSWKKQAGDVKLKYREFMKHL